MSKSAKRRHRTVAEKIQLVEDWQASGEGAERFARGRGMSASSLYVWRKQLGTEARRVGPGSRGVDFVPVVLESFDSADTGGLPGWQLQTRSGLVLTMSGPDAVRGLEVALRALGIEARA